MALNLTTVLVLNDNGDIDEAASLVAFTDSLSAYKAERETQEATISAAVHAQFDKYPGAAQNMPALVHGVLRDLNVGPATYSAMEEKVLAYIRENSDRPQKIDRKTKAVIQVAEPPRTRTFGIRKGRGGGVSRWSDVPVGEE